MTTLHNALVDPLCLIFKSIDFDFNFLVSRISNWMGVQMHNCFRLKDSDNICFEARVFCMKLQIEEVNINGSTFVCCYLGLNDDSEDFRLYQPVVLFLLFMLLNRRLSVFEAQIKSTTTLIADYFTSEGKKVHDRLAPDLSVDHPFYLSILINKLPPLET